MPVRYSRQIEKTGAAVGSVVSVVRPLTYTTSTNEETESSNWDIDNTYPGWLECDGRTLNVSEYRALYSVIGNTYGGTVDSTFKLPDYRSKKICGTGTLNGNSGSSISLPTIIAPNGTPGGEQNIAGSSGGFYTLSTFRQLPPNSEVTPGSPSSPLELGGTSVDTFSLGTFVSSGFSNVTESVDCQLTGTVTFGVGPVSDVSVSANPPHFHFTECTQIGSQRATTGEPAQSISHNFFQGTDATIRSFNRGLRRWPGAATGNFGGTDISGEPSDLIAAGVLSIGAGTRIRPYGSGTGLNGFQNFGSSSTGQYLGFDTGTVDPITRTATLTVDGSQVTEFFIFAIAGNDANGGERVNTAGEGLRVSFNGVLQPGYIVEAAGDYYGGPITDGFAAYDAEYQDWKLRTYPIDAVYRTNPLTVTLSQTAESEGDSGPGITDWDSIGIGRLGVSGSGDNFEYTGGDTPIILQRHSHMVFWDEPNSGDTVPGTPNTFGTGGFADLNFDGSSNGLRSGTSAETVVATNSSIGFTLTKTIDIINDLGVSVRPALVTMTDASRTAFDNAISVRLQAAEELVLLSPYFRSKYIIKAY
jgi:hypothetical protein